MKLYIPEIGDRIRLTADWTFGLINEDRNATLMEFIGDPRETKYSYRDPFTTEPCTIPAGTILKIDRLYIRKGLEDFSSVTFFWEGARTKSKVEEKTMTSYMAVAVKTPVWPSFPGITSAVKQNPVTSTYQVKKPARPVRFWAKLSDVNTIEFEEA